MKRLFASLFLWAAMAAAPAWAQLGLPLPPTPSLPVPDLGEVVDETRGVSDRLGRQVEDVRRLRVRELLRENRRVLEADPDGQPIVRSQIIAVGMNAAAIARARDDGFEIVGDDPVGEDLSLVTLRAPRGMSTRRALRHLREADPSGVYDFDHLHLEGGAVLAAPAFAQAGAASPGPRIGLIDSGVDGSVAARRSFAGSAPVAGVHGTAIAGLISRAAPGARIYSADIYGGEPTGGSSSTLTRALAWLAQERVPVINISLVGPRNRVVETVIARMIARGFVIVAAVGNDGPAAPPLYPAAYAGVVGVTGVDARDRVLNEAGRGAQVDFAALAIHGQSRGTSFAAPLVSAQLARRLNTPDRAHADGAIRALRDAARDLGSRGRDDVYGYGLISD